MLQVRQLSLVTSHPYLPYIALHFWAFFNLSFLGGDNKVIPMQLSIKGVWPVQDESRLSMETKVCSRSGELL